MASLKCFTAASAFLLAFSITSRGVLQYAPTSPLTSFTPVTNTLCFIPQDFKICVRRSDLDARINRGNSLACRNFWPGQTPTAPTFLTCLINFLRRHSQLKMLPAYCIRLFLHRHL